MGKKTKGKKEKKGTKGTKKSARAHSKEPEDPVAESVGESPPEPVVEPASDPEPKAEAASEPEPKPDSSSEPEPKQEPDPKPEPKQEPEPDPKPEPKQEPEPDSKPKPKQVESVQDELMGSMDEMRQEHVLAELEGLPDNVPKDKVAAIRAKAEDPATLDQAQAELHQLKEGLKQAFFTSFFTGDAGTQPADDAEMVLEAIFLLYKNGKILSYWTAMPKERRDMDLVKDWVRGIKGLTRHVTPDRPARGKVNDLNLMLQRGQLVFLGLVHRHKEHPLAERMTTKAVSVIEDRFGDLLTDWGGDLKQLAEVNRSTRALVSAFERLKNV